MDILNSIMQWIVAPLAGFVYILHQRVNSNSTDIAVLKAEKASHDREFRQLRDDMRSIITKLDSIELALRK